MLMRECRLTGNVCVSFPTRACVRVCVQCGGKIGADLEQLERYVRVRTPRFCHSVFIVLI